MLNSDYTVKTEFVNKNTGEHYSQEYPFDAYCNNISFQLKQVLYDVENAFYRAENYKDRDQWDDEQKELFGKIRKKLLDGVNGIARLPNSLNYKGRPCNSMTGGELIASLINRK